MYSESGIYRPALACGKPGLLVWALGRLPWETSLKLGSIFSLGFGILCSYAHQDGPTGYRLTVRGSYDAVWGTEAPRWYNLGDALSVFSRASK